ncbi:hypothetical protein STEG23_031132 [Scotinomys teguina]
MGSGSSRSGRIPRLRRSPDRRQADPGETTLEGGTADQALTAATQEETGHDPRPATPPGGREETLRLLDQLLAESEAWGPQEPTPRVPARLPPALPYPLLLNTCNNTPAVLEKTIKNQRSGLARLCCYKAKIQNRLLAGRGGQRQVFLCSTGCPGTRSVDQAGFRLTEILVLALKVSPEKKIKDTLEDSCASEAPGSSHKRPEGQSTISYDYSEEELMASIEKEYCR